MTIEEALQALQEGSSIIVGDKTFTPKTIDKVRLETGEHVYWVRSDETIWVSLDVDSEEVIVFTDVEEEFDYEEDSHFYVNEDYELSFETEAKMVDEDEEEEPVNWKDYESDAGRVLRITQYSVSGDQIVSSGQKLPEDALNEL